MTLNCPNAARFTNFGSPFVTLEQIKIHIANLVHKLITARRASNKVSDAIYTRKLKFLTKLQSTEIGLCKHFVKNTADELATVHECIV